MQNFQRSSGTVAGILKPPKDQMQNFQEQNSWSEVLVDTLENPSSERSWIQEGMVSNNSLYQQSLRFYHRLPPLQCDIQGTQTSVGHFELEAVERPSYFTISGSKKVENRDTASEFMTSFKDTSVDHCESEAGRGHPCFSISGPDEDVNLESFFENRFCLDDIVGCTRNITAVPQCDKALIAEPVEVEYWKAFSKTQSCFEDMDHAVNVSEVPLLDDAMIRQEALMIASKIAGKVFYEKMEKARSPILPPLLASLETTLQKFKEEGLEVTSTVVRKEACKWVYTFMRDQNQKVAAHPGCIKEIPSNWLLQNGNLYPSEKNMQKIAEDLGLNVKQVVHLFDNVRKRTFKNKSPLSANLKSHFSQEITEKLRKWQSQNFGKQPDPKARQDLMLQTNCNKKQIVDWFNNHKEGRNRSKKRIYPL